jgi:hypothetical protein
VGVRFKQELSSHETGLLAGLRGGKRHRSSGHWRGTSFGSVKDRPDRCFTVLTNVLASGLQELSYTPPVRPRR